MCLFANEAETLLKWSPVLISFIALGVTPFATYLVTRSTSRAQILANKRQDWINELRGLLSEFRDNIGRYHLDVIKVPMPGLTGPLSNDQKFSIYSRNALLSFKIQLMLSPDFKKNPDNKIILDQIKIMMDMFGKESAIGVRGSPEEKALESSIKTFEDVSKRILKDAWEKIKKFE